MTLQKYTNKKDDEGSEIEELETQRQKTIRKLRERAKDADFGGEIKK